MACKVWSIFVLGGRISKKWNESLSGVLGARPLLHIRLAVWVHKSPNGAKRRECAFMRILLHKNKVFYGNFWNENSMILSELAPNWRKVSFMQFNRQIIDFFITLQCLF